jgi:hypothetical protein
MCAAESACRSKRTELHGGPVTPPTVLTADATATGDVYITAIQPLPVPNASSLNLPRPGGEASWALAGVLMLGLGLQGRKAHRSMRLSLAVGMLIGLGGIGACVSNIITLTPGVYTYTFTASELNNTSLSASTTVNVTVPAGIVVQPGIGAY